MKKQPNNKPLQDGQESDNFSYLSFEGKIMRTAEIQEQLAQNERVKKLRRESGLEESKQRKDPLGLNNGQKSKKRIHEEFLYNYSGLGTAHERLKQQKSTKPRLERQVSQCCQVTAMLLMLIIVIVSVSKFNNPKFAYNAYTHYSNMITDGYDDVVDKDSLVKWNKHFMAKMLYYEQEKGVAIDDTIMQMPGEESLEDNAFVNFHNTNLNQVSVGYTCFQTIRSITHECARNIDKEEKKTTNVNG